MGDSMKFILIRHGETYANALYNTENRILIGALDAPVSQLNEIGKQQAKQAREKMKDIVIDAIYSSDLGRTKETAEIIFGEQRITYTSLLRERSLGSDQGKRVDEVFNQPDVWKYHVNVEEDSLEDCLTKKVVDGECYQDVIQRCQTFLNEFDFSANRTVAVVSHFHFIRCFIYQLLKKDVDRDMFTMMIPNAEPLIFEWNGHTFVEVK